MAETRTKPSFQTDWKTLSTSWCIMAKETVPEYRRDAQAYLGKAELGKPSLPFLALRTGVQQVGSAQESQVLMQARGHTSLLPSLESMN